MEGTTICEGACKFPRVWPIGSLASQLNNFFFLLRLSRNDNLFLFMINDMCWTLWILRMHHDTPICIIISMIRLRSLSYCVMLGGLHICFLCGFHVSFILKIDPTLLLHVISTFKDVLDPTSTWFGSACGSTCAHRSSFRARLRPGEGGRASSRRGSEGDTTPASTSLQQSDHHYPDG